MNEEVEQVLISDSQKKNSRMNRINYIGISLFVMFIAPMILTALLHKIGIVVYEVTPVVKEMMNGDLGKGFRTRINIFAFWYVQIPLLIYITTLRIRDIGWSIWLTAPVMLPIVNFIVWFWPGEKKDNANGPVTDKAPIGTKIFVFGSPFIIGLVYLMTFKIIES